MAVERTEMVEAHLDGQGRHVDAYFVPDETHTYGPVVSSSAGFVWRRQDSPLSVAANIGSGWRAPTPVELYIRGVHHASYEYVTGDRRLDPELALNTDLILRWAGRDVAAEASVFYNHIRDYIFQHPTGAFCYLNEFANLPMHEYEQLECAVPGRAREAAPAADPHPPCRAGAPGGVRERDQPRCGSRRPR